MRLSKGFQFTFLAALSWAIAIVTTRVVLQNGENVFNVAFWIAILSTPYWLVQIIGGILIILGSIAVKKLKI